MTSTFDFTLRYGNPPERSACRDLGAEDTPGVISNSDPDMGGDIRLYELYGGRLPKWAQVRHVIRSRRSEKLPYTIRIKGLGQLNVGPEGWEIE